mmetsp:Transcript_3995/g.11159  ORF Transcript_3995/g.11159 Transcript_3995/m.11159 type:complete len:204 (-) Transcript_3995:821-1432(-)
MQQGIAQHLHERVFLRGEVATSLVALGGGVRLEALHELGKILSYRLGEVRIRPPLDENTHWFSDVDATDLDQTSVDHVGTRLCCRSPPLHVGLQIDLDPIHVGHVSAHEGCLTQGIACPHGMFDKQVDSRTCLSQAPFDMMHLGRLRSCHAVINDSPELSCVMIGDTIFQTFGSSPGSKFCEHRLKEGSPVARRESWVLCCLT